MNSLNFHILQEEYFDYKNKEYFSLMIIREYDKYSVEVISKTKSHGRIYLSSKKEAKDLFEELIIKLRAINTFKESCDMLALLKTSKTVLEAIFILRVFGRKLNQDQIGKLMSIYKLKVKSKIKKDDSMTIQMFFEGNKTSFGSFTGTFLCQNFVFKKT